MGIATDHCVLARALYAATAGFAVTVRLDDPKSFAAVKAAGLEETRIIE